MAELDSIRQVPTGRWIEDPLRDSMNRIPVLFLGLVSANLLLVGCSSVKPAGSLGYMMNGDPLATPVPTNYRHVPPMDEGRGPMRFQTSF